MEPYKTNGTSLEECKQTCASRMRDGCTNIMHSNTNDCWMFNCEPVPEPTVKWSDGERGYIIDSSEEALWFPRLNFVLQFFPAFDQRGAKKVLNKIFSETCPDQFFLKLNGGVANDYRVFEGEWNKGMGVREEWGKILDWKHSRNEYWEHFSKKYQLWFTTEEIVDGRWHMALKDRKGNWSPKYGLRTSGHNFSCNNQGPFLQTSNVPSFD